MDCALFYLTFIFPGKSHRDWKPLFQRSHITITTTCWHHLFFINFLFSPFILLVLNCPRTISFGTRGKNVCILPNLTQLMRRKNRGHTLQRNKSKSKFEIFFHFVCVLHYFQIWGCTLCLSSQCSAIKNVPPFNDLPVHVASSEQWNMSLLTPPFHDLTGELSFVVFNVWKLRAFFSKSECFI